MSDNKNTTIHDFDFEFICDYFSGLPRQGPGNAASTLKALSFIGNHPERKDYRIADLGCGTGTQTITLAGNTNGKVTALDLFPKFLGILERRAKEAGLGGQVETLAGSMCELPFTAGQFDLIWSEGAIYNIGFRKGLEYWRQFIKPGGYVAVTEATWLTPERPSEIQQFWDEHYPEVDTIPNNTALMQDAGYIPVAHFILPDECWLVDFYGPAAARQKAFLEEYNGSEAASRLVESERKDEEIYRKYSDYYGYVFYIGKKL